MTTGLSSVSTVLSRLLWSNAGIRLRTSRRSSSVMHGNLTGLLRGLTMKVWHSIGIGWSSLWLVAVLAELVRASPLAASRLRDIRNDLHTAWNNACRSTAPSSVRRGSRTTESFRELLH